MKHSIAILGFIVVALALLMLMNSVHIPSASASSATANIPAYSADGRLSLPANYREWVFLTSGFGMNYSNGGGHSPMFTNVFVTPEAYQGFLRDGKWPDKSMFVVEIYSPSSQGSINRSGYYQSAFQGLDVEVKDASRPHEWSYYGFNSGEASAAPEPPGCNKCHSEHAAVEHTFVQFYPTLLEFSTKKGLIKPSTNSKE